MAKSLFEKLDQLNKLDIEFGSKYVQVTGPQNIISVDKKGNHGEVKIGVSADIPMDIFKGKDLRLMLIIVDGERYDNIKD